jgi:uncharacterized protein (DUF2141 family)
MLGLGGDDSGDEDTYTLTGTLTGPSGITVDGKTAYVKLVTRDADGSAAARYFKSTTFSGSNATSSIPNITADTYTLYAFIDMNGNAPGTSLSAPDGGDYSYGGAGTSNITIPNTTVKNIQGSDWTMQPTSTLAGTLTCPVSAVGKTAYLKIVANGEPFTATAIKSTSVVFDTQNKVYTIADIPDGTYSGWAFIDMDGDADTSNPQPDNGDLTPGGSLAVTVPSATPIDGNIGESSWSTFLSYTVSGTMYISDSSVVGKLGYIKLVTAGAARTATPICSGVTAAFAFNGTDYSAAFTVNNIPAGTYTGYGFIDIDGNADSSNPHPSSGDYVFGDPAPGFYKTISGDSSTGNDVPDMAWSVYP